jgi:hypothetical protein
MSNSRRHKRVPSLKYIFLKFMDIMAQKTTNKGGSVDTYAPGGRVAIFQESLLQPHIYTHGT